MEGHHLSLCVVPPMELLDGATKTSAKPVPPVLRKSEAARRGVDASDRFHSELWSKRVISALQRAGNMI